MITKFFKAVAIKAPPVGPSAKLARIFLSSIPPKRRSQIDVKFELLEPSSPDAQLQVTFRDNAQVVADLNKLSTREMTELFDRQSRKLQIEEAITM